MAGLQGERRGSNSQFDSPFERLLQGQDKLEHAVETLQRSVDNLTQVVRGAVDMQRTMAADVHRTVTPSSLPNASTTLAMAKEMSKSRGSLGEGSQSPTSPASEQAGTGFMPVRTAGTNLTATMASTLGSGRSVLPHPLFADHAMAVRRNLDGGAQHLLDFVFGSDAVAALHVPFWARSSSVLSMRQMVATANRYFPLHPVGMVPTVFDCLSAFVLLIDAVIIPVMIAWEIPAQGPLLWVAVCTLFFWLCDMGLKFSTGFVEGAGIVRDWHVIVRRYLKGLFAFDCTLIMIDAVDLVYVLATSAPLAQHLRAIRFLRFIKMTRMIRIWTRMTSSMGVVRVDAMISVWVMNTFGACSNAVHYFNILGILVRLVFAIVGMSHMLACGWYYLLRTSAETDPSSWENSLPEMDDVGLYLYSVYWSISTMFAGASVLPPVLKWEMVWSTLLLLVGTLFMTSMTSTLAAMLIEAQQSWVDMKKRLGLLTQFMEQRNVPGLVLVIVHEDYVKSTSSSDYKMTELDVQASLSVLSPDVRTLLRDVQYGPSFEKVFLFRLLHVHDADAIEALCLLASFHLTSTEQEVFTAKKEISEAMLLHRGRARYVHTPIGVASACSSSSLRPVEAVGHDTWICEAALLLTWRTVGRLVSETPCEMLAVSAEDFTKVASRMSPSLAVVSSFCERYHAAIYGEDGGGHGVGATDISLGVDGDTVVTDMPNVVRQELVSIPMLECLRNKMGTLGAYFSSNELLELEEEVRLSRCHLAMDERGDIRRVVKFVALQLEDPDGHICVQLADVTAADQIEMNFGLPVRQVLGEDSCIRVVEKLLHPFSAFMQNIELLGVEDEEHIEHVRPRPGATVGTKKIKIIYRAVLHGRITSWLTAEAPTTMPTSPRSTTTGKNQLAGADGGVFSMTTGSTFALDAEGRGRLVYQWLHPAVFQQYWRDRDAQAATLKVRLAQLSTHQKDAMSRVCFNPCQMRTDESPRSPLTDGGRASPIRLRTSTPQAASPGGLTPVTSEASAATEGEASLDAAPRAGMAWVKLTM